MAEKLVDLDDALAAWRHKHMLTVERIIGMKKGTGGSEGVGLPCLNFVEARLSGVVVPEDRTLSFKPLFTKSLGARPGACISPPTVITYGPTHRSKARSQCWEDAAAQADHKWDKVMGEVWPEAQAHVAAELGSGDPSAIVFASNTHDFLIRLAAACPRRTDGPLARADERRRISFRAAADGALGGRRRD